MRPSIVIANKTSGRVCAIVCMALCALNTLGATFAWACQENAMIVLDASGSMALFRDGHPKINTARKAIASVLPDVTRYRPTGLVTYSGDRGPACEDVVLRVPPKVESDEQILAAIDRLQPNGATPLSDGVQLAVETLQRRGGTGIVVLVTDGLENCGNDACALSRQIKARAPNILVHVISFYLHGKIVETISCLSKNTGGTYAETNSLQTLSDALRRVLSCHRISMR